MGSDMPTSNDSLPVSSLPSCRTVEVRIYNQTYSIRGDGNSSYITELSSYVDEKMKEVAKVTLTVDSLRVAILAALNIVDELHQARKKITELDALIAERSSEYADLLDSVLKRSDEDEDIFSTQSDLS